LKQLGVLKGGWINIIMFGDPLGRFCATFRGI
jgi:hypothetical protein